MNTFTPGENLNNIGTKLMENLSEQLLPLFDMTDAKTGEFYWVFVMMAGQSIAVQLQALARFDGVKFASPLKTPPIS